MEEVDKIPFLDAPIWSGSLFGPAVEGFAERFTESQKSSQAMHTFTPTHKLYFCFQSPQICADSADSQTSVNHPGARPPEERRDRGRSCSARRYSFPKRQGPRPKIALDLVPKKSSCSARQKEAGPESTYCWTTPQKASHVSLATSRNAGCRGKSVFGSLLARYGAQVSDSCDSGQNKTLTFSKKEQASFSASLKRPAIMQPVCTTVSTPCHTGRGLAGHPRCVSVGNEHGKIRLFTPIRSKTTTLLRCARYLSAQ